MLRFGFVQDIDGIHYLCKLSWWEIRALLVSCGCPFQEFPVGFAWDHIILDPYTVYNSFLKLWAWKLVVVPPKILQKIWHTLLWAAFIANVQQTKLPRERNPISWTLFVCWSFAQDYMSQGFLLKAAGSSFPRTYWKTCTSTPRQKPTRCYFFPNVQKCSRMNVYNVGNDWAEPCWAL